MFTYRNGHTVLNRLEVNNTNGYLRLTLESVRFVVESVRAKWCPIRIITAFSQNYTFKKISRVYIFVNIYIGTYSETFFVVYIGYE